MAKTSKKVDSLFIQEQNKDFLKPEYLTVPHTAIVNRAPMIDPTQDLGVRMGVNRIQTHGLMELPNEQGPNGETVWGVYNDKFNQIRCVGDWTEANSTEGVYIISSTVESFIEVTFYGTGLNAMLQVDNTVRDFRVTIDDDPEGGNLYPSSMSAVLNNRRYSSNQIINLASNLTEGVHTAKIRLASGVNIRFHGFEVLNEATELTVSKGNYFNDGKLLRLLNETTTSYNSDFTNEYGTSGTKGGAVSVYLTESGDIKKDIQWTDVSAQYLASSDHSNEEVINHYNFRDFGCGRGDDFSSMIDSAGNRAYTMDDGTTTLVGTNVRTVANEEKGFFITAVSSFWFITFVGTGLDLAYSSDFTGTIDAHEIFIDNNSIGTITPPVVNGERKRLKICSGLPYGTHTVKVVRNVSSAGAFFTKEFFVYGPKKPEIEESSVELGSYNLMADYLPVTLVTSPEGNRGEYISQGVLRKQLMREMSYQASWTGPSLDPGWASGFQFTQTDNNEYIEYSFVGTGIDFMYTYSAQPLVKVELDGAELGSTGTVNVDNGTYDTGTSIITESNSVLFKLTDLPFGSHTIRFYKTAGTNFIPSYFDVHTPIHTPKRNGPFVIQGTAHIGSQSVGDSRKIEKEDVMVYKSRDIIGGITVAQNVGQPQGIPIQDCIQTFYLDEDSEVEIEFETKWTASAFGGQPDFKFFVDGKQYEYSMSTNLTTANWGNSMFIKKTLKLSKGWHNTFISLFTGAGGTVSSSANGRTLTVKKIK